LVEHHVANVVVVGSNPITRSLYLSFACSLLNEGLTAFFAGFAAGSGISPAFFFGYFWRLRFAPLLPGATR